MAGHERIGRGEAIQLVASLGDTPDAAWLRQLFVGCNSEAFVSRSRLARCRASIAPDELVEDIVEEETTPTIESEDTEDEDLQG